MKKKQRLYFILFILGCLSAAVGISLYALQDNIAFFYSPMEVHQLQSQHAALVAPERRFRLGGLVKTGSVQKRKQSLVIHFTITDDVKEIPVEYAGLLPDLFREGQGVVATGALNEKGVFIATELLAKHDENYMPPEVVKGMKNRRKGE